MNKEDFRKLGAIILLLFSCSGLIYVLIKYLTKNG